MATLEPTLQAESISPNVLVRRLHLILMGIKADASEATNIVRSERAKEDLDKGIKEADALVLKLQEMLP